MSDSTKDAQEAFAHRVRRILGQALLATEIPCLDNTNLSPPESPLGGTNVGWRIKNNDVELVFYSKTLWLGPLQCSVSLKALARDVSQLLLYDEAKAVTALTDALYYLCFEIAQILPSLDLHLSARSLNAVDKKDLKEVEKRIPSAKKLFEFLAQMKKAGENQRKELEKQLRAERDQRGGSEAKHDWTDNELECLATKYDDLKPIWLEAKRIAKDAQKSRERSRRTGWRAEVLRAYPSLPVDLLDRFSNPRADDAKPSDLAIIHATRECGISVSYSAREVRGKIRTWKSKTA